MCKGYEVTEDNRDVAELEGEKSSLLRACSKRDQQIKELQQICAKNAKSLAEYERLKSVLKFDHPDDLIECERTHTKIIEAAKRLAEEVRLGFGNNLKARNLAARIKQILKASGIPLPLDFTEPLIQEPTSKKVPDGDEGLGR